MCKSKRGRRRIENSKNEGILKNSGAMINKGVSEINATKTEGFSRTTMN